MAKMLARGNTFRDFYHSSQYSVLYSNIISVKEEQS